MTIVREIKEAAQNSPALQGIEESVIYTLTVPTTWGTPSGTPTVKVYSYVSAAYTDVTSTVMPTNSPTAVSQVITMSLLTALTESVLYRVEIKFSTSEGNTLEAYGWVKAVR